MTKEPLLNYYSALLKKWNADFQLAIKFSGANVIHDLRVDTKRLRAFLRLAAALNPDFEPADVLRCLKAPFKHAGSVRHYQVQMSLTKRYMEELGLKLDWYYNLLKSQEIRTRKKFRTKCAGFDRQPFLRSQKSLRRLLVHQNHDELSVGIGRSVAQLVGELRSQSNLTENSEIDYHAIRVLAKTTRYSLEILRKHAGDSKELESADKILIGLHQPLGAWHDLDLAAGELLAAGSNFDDSDGVCAESIAKFRSALATERDLQLELFRSRWIDFIGNADLGQSPS